MVIKDNSPDMNVQRFYELIDRDETPAIEEQQSLRNLVDQYPYFQPCIFIYLKSLYQSGNYSDFESELSRISIFVNDRKALFYYIFSDEYKLFFAQTGKKEIKEDRTNILLNAFFESKNNTEDNAQLEYTIANSSIASNDYFSYLETVEHKTLDDNYVSPASSTYPLRHQSIIDSFIEKSEENGGIKIQFDKNITTETTIGKTEEIDQDELTDDMFFTETLAKIYIKQKKYEKAYKIIKHLSLNYPKKNIYFADQLSFLEKLIINSKYKK